MLKTATLAIALAVSVSGIARADSPKPVNVPAGDLTTALELLEKQSGVEIVYRPELLKGLHTDGVKGTLSSEEAVTRLLKGTTLRLHGDRTGVLLITEAGSEGTAASKVGGTELAAKQQDQPSSGDRLPLAQTNQGQDQSAVSVEKASQNSSEGAENKKASRSEAAKDRLSEMVVTGTHIRGLESIGSPTMTITREEIDQTGYATVQDLMASLPQNFNGLTPIGLLGENGTTIRGTNFTNSTAIDLRGLGPESTLTLIDGNRVAGNIEGRAVDISLIPLSMVERIDIITGGASAIYGADAVGGVVNIVLRHSYDGADTQVDYGGTRKGGDRLELSQIFGREFDRSGFVLGYEFSRDSAFDIVRTGLVAQTAAGLVLRSQDVVPADRRHSVYLAGHFDPNESIQFYGESSYVHKTQESFNDEVFPAFDFEGKGRTQQSTSEYSGKLGVKIGLRGSWKLDVSGSASVLENSAATNNDDVFGGAAFSSDYAINTRSALTSFSAIADGEVANVGGIRIRGAIGAETRRETLTDTPVATSIGGNIPFVQRRINSAFAELNIPLVQNGPRAGLHSLELSLAARDDHYSDFGNAFNPQASLVWQPYEGLNVRGAFAKAFRAPDLYSLNVPPNVNLGTETVATPGNAAGTPLPALTADLGNPNLKPERATTWSTGFDYQFSAAPAVRLSFSYFHIDYNDRIQNPFRSSLIDSTLYPGSLLNLHPTAAQVQNYLALGPVQANQTGIAWDGNPQTLLSQIPNLIIADDRYQNLSIETLRVIDVIVESTWSIPLGTVKAGANITDTLSHRFKVTTDSPSGSLINQVGAPVGFRLRASAGLTQGAYGAFLFLNYLDSYQDQFTTPISRIASWTTLDMTLRFDSAQILERGPFSNITVIASVQNLMDRDPPRFGESTFGLLFDPVNSNGLGRFISLRVGKKW